MIEGLVTVSAKQLERKITYRVPVVIELLYNSGLDIDNHGLLAKAIIDGLRYANILEDDNKRCVVGLFQRFTSNPGVTIIISPAKDKHVNIEDIIEMTG
jgi:Holliday junction resolvase RusA-like endonuclease